jgi:hypothetical protein
MKVYFFLFAVLVSTQAFSQKFTISGTIKDANSGENLIGASIYNAKTHQGTTANTYGFFSLTQQTDSAKIRVSYVGYEPKAIVFLLTRDTVVNVTLASGTNLQEVVISGTSEDRIQESTRMGTIDVPL